MPLELFVRLRGSRAGRAFWQERSGEEVALGVGRGEGARGGVGVCREQRSLWALCRVGLPGGEGSWEPRAGVQCPHRASLLPFPLSQPCLGSPCWVGPSHWLGKLWTRAGAQLVGDEGVGGRGVWGLCQQRGQGAGLRCPAASGSERLKGCLVCTFVFVTDTLCSPNTNPQNQIERSP